MRALRSAPGLLLFSCALELRYRKGGGLAGEAHAGRSFRHKGGRELARVTDDSAVAVALVRAGTGGAIALGDAIVPQPGAVRSTPTGLRWGCCFARRIQWRHSCVDVDAASP
jgi:hypothetical protein